MTCASPRACGARLLFLLLAAHTPGLNAQSSRDRARQTFDLFQHEKHYAVVVGINKYPRDSFPLLQYAVADADAMEKTLGAAAKFEVTKIPGADATTQSVMDALHAVAASAEENATVLFYFAGHGGEVSGKQYLASYEATPSSLARGLALDDIKQELKNSKARRKILLIDACRADLQASATRGTLVERFGLFSDAAGSGLLVLNATGEKQSSYEEPQFGHGVFTQFLIRGLQGEAADDYGLVYFSGLSRYVEENVRTWVRKRFGAFQDPRFSSVDTSGDFLLGGELKAAAAQSSAPAAQPIDPVEDAFHRAESAANRAEMLRAFAVLFPRSQFAPLAEYDAAAFDPKPAKAYYDLGLKFRDMGEHPIAIAAFSRALNADPNNIAAAGYRVYELAADLALDDAVIEGTRVLKAQPGNIPAMVGRGMAFFRFGMIPESRADLLQVTASLPADAIGFHFRGDAWWLMKEFDKAIADFTKAIELRPDLGIAYNDRANVYNDQQNYPQAIAGYTDALRILSNNPVIWANRGTENAIAGNSDAAMQDFAEALRLRPGLAWAYLARGSLFFNREKYAEAIADYTAALQQTGFVYAPTALAGRAEAYMRAGKFREAVEDLTEFIRMVPDQPFAFEHRAQAREKLGDQAGAAADRAQAERLKKK
jgi:tetratricopeptide (TPR) repeat protein